MAKELIKSEFRRMVNAMTTTDEVRAAWDVLKQRWNDIQREAAFEASRSFHTGDVVAFDSRKRGGRVIVGRIERINAKTISLRECRFEDGSFSGERWKVAPAFLRAYPNGLPKLHPTLGKPLFGSRSEHLPV